MKKGILVLLTVALLLAPSVTVCQTAEIVTTVAGDIIVGDLIADLDARVKSSIRQAMQSGDYLVEKVASVLGLQIAEMRVMLKEDMKTSVRRLEQDFQDAVNVLNQNVLRFESDVFKGILEIEDFVYLDAKDIVTDLPFIHKEYLLRRIEGRSQSFKPAGTYEIDMVGNAFADENEVVISFDGKELPEEYVDNSRANLLKITVPSSELNEFFADTSVVYLPIDLSVVKKVKKPFWKRFITLFLSDSHTNSQVYTYSGNVVLMPRKQVRCLAEEIIEVAEWGEWESKAHSVTSPGNGNDVKGEDPHHIVQICLDLTSDWEIDKSSLSFSVSPHDPNSFGKVTKGFTLVGTKACVTYKDWYCCGRVLTITCNARQRTYSRQNRLLEIQSVLEHEATLDGYLEIGRTYECAIGDRHQSYSLSFKYFNGSEVVVTPTSKPINHIAVNRDLNGGRLLISVDGM